jgi:hypothetical protein
MNIEYFPSTVLYDIVKNYLIGHDQLKISFLAKKYLYLNEGNFASILRSTNEVDLGDFIRAIIDHNSPYVQTRQRLYLRKTNISWPCILPKSFDVNTFNKVWAFYTTDLFSLYVRLFSYSPFFYRPDFTLLDLFEFPCKFSNSIDW